MLLDSCLFLVSGYFFNARYDNMGCYRAKMILTGTGDSKVLVDNAPILPRSG